MIIGVDEAGRGALAGPISVGLSLVSEELPVHTFSYDRSQKYPDSLKRINDSKQLSEKKREEIYAVIKDQMQCQVLFVPPQLIDTIGLSLCIQTCIVLGLTHWVQEFDLQDSTIYLDASLKVPATLDRGLCKVLLERNDIDDKVLRFLQSKSTALFDDQLDVRWVYDHFQSISSHVKGDARFLSIASASIAAKVERDRLMVDLHNQFPEYCWCGNKGYAAQVHRKAIIEYGTNPHHRMSFLTNLLGN
jgi:ribonuclease HII